MNQRLFVHCCIKQIDITVRHHHIELFIVCCRPSMGSGQSSKHNAEKKGGGYPEYGQHQPSGPPPDYPGHAPSSAPPMTQLQSSDRPPAYSSAPNNSLVGASGTNSPEMKNLSELSKMSREMLTLAVKF